MMRIKINIISLLVFGFTSLSAQEKLPTDTFVIIKSYRPTIVDAEKISFIPRIDDEPMKLESKLNYSFLNKQIPVSFSVDPINAAKIKGEPLVKLYNGYAKVGVGNALIPSAEIYYNNSRSKEYAWGSHVKYTKLKELNKIKSSDQSSAHLALYGKRFWRKNTIESNIKYDFHKFNYYGLFELPDEFELPITSGSTEQNYNRIGVNVGLISTKKDSFNLRHKGNLAYNYITANNGAKEHNILAKANLSQFVNSELYNLDFLWDYNQYEYTSNNSIVGLKPQISTIGDNFRITVGLGMYINASHSADFHFYPLAEIKYNVIKDFLVPYAGLRGQIRRNSYNGITLENPFVGEDVIIVNTNEKYNLYGGVRGTLSKATSFNLSASTKKIEDEYFYIKSNSTSNSIDDRFSLIYDDVDELEIKGELAYRKNNKIRVYLLGQYLNYNTKTELKAWHRPNIKITGSGEYNLMKKIIINADVFYWGEQYAKSIELQPSGSGLANEIASEKLDGIIDANLGFEYRYTKKLSAFIDFNNIGGINYQKYQDYPNQGFNVLGGLTYSF